MPTFAIDTNVSRDSIPEEFGPELTALISKVTGKPLWAITVDISTGQLMYRNGTPDPVVQCHFYSFTQALFTKEATTKFTAEVTTFIYEKLGVSTERITFIFHPISSGHLVGLDGKVL